MIFSYGAAAFEPHKDASLLFIDININAGSKTKLYLLKASPQIAHANLSLRAHYFDRRFVEGWLRSTFVALSGDTLGIVGIIHIRLDYHRIVM